jgi:hypothetical protein
MSWLWSDDDERTCPACQRPLEYVEPGPAEPAQLEGNTFIVKLASDIFRCPIHGLLRIYLSGEFEHWSELKHP